MQSGRSYRLRVAKDPQRLVGALSALPGIATPRVSSTDGESGDIEFALAESMGESVIDDVARRTIDGGHGLRELAAKTKSLEEVFFQLTK